MADEPRATRWVLLIRGRFDRLTFVEFKEPMTAAHAWAEARRKLTLEDLDQVTEILATPTGHMQAVTP